MLRDSLNRPHDTTSPVEPTPPAPTATASASAGFNSPERYASFEARVRQRRIDQRIAAARAAIAARRFGDATIAIDELIELEPGLPASSELAAELAAAVTARSRRRLVLAVAASWTVAGATLGFLVGRQPQWSPDALRAILMQRAAHLPSRALLPDGDIVRIPSPRPLVPGGSQNTAVRAVAPEPPAAQHEGATPEPPVPTPPAEPASVAAGTPVPAKGDTTMIWETLDRYRRAYSSLDAPRVHAVYPGVDETALARAFEEFRSQSIEFESCTVDAQEKSARAVCRGSVRYVPATGNPAPRTERRVWTFSLSRDTGDWTITSAWANRYRQVPGEDGTPTSDTLPERR